MAFISFSTATTKKVVEQIAPNTNTTKQSSVGAITKTPFEVLYELLDIDEMSEEQQQAVWTLLRFLKKRGSG